MQAPENYYPELAQQPIYQQALGLIMAAYDDPQARYQIRADFYKRYGQAHIGKHGLGNSELAFLSWEIERGVLNPPNHERPGSAWWRAVNAFFIFGSTYAALLWEAGLDVPAIPELQAWHHYLQAPNAQSWYRAHNTSIVAAYARYPSLAEAETVYERQFLNMVLYRLLFAGALNEGAEWGFVGELLANPRLPSVEVLVQLPDFYPRHYPLTQSDIDNLLHPDHSLIDLGVRVLDNWLILPQINDLYRFSARLLHMPRLADWICQQQPCYALPQPSQPHWTKRAWSFFVRFFFWQRLSLPWLWRRLRS